MYTAKQAHLLRDKIPDANITVLYMDVRAFGKGFEEFYERVQKERIVYRRGNPSEIFRRNGNLVVRGEDTLLGEPFELEADLVVLASGLVPRKEDESLKNMLGLEKSSDKFYEEAPGLDPIHDQSGGNLSRGMLSGTQRHPGHSGPGKRCCFLGLRPPGKRKKNKWSNWSNGVLDHKTFSFSILFHTHYSNTR